MPTYEYKCDGCEHQFEVVESIHADAQQICPKCNDNKLHRLIFGGLMARSSTPRTLGALADRNSRALDRRGELPKQVRRRKDYTIPWWRAGKHKPDMKVLQNPVRYIEEGKG